MNTKMIIKIILYHYNYKIATFTCEIQKILVLLRTKVNSTFVRF